MQERIVKVVPRLSEEKLIEELLAANDEMNTAFTRYQRSTVFIIIILLYLFRKLDDYNISTGCFLPFNDIIFCLQV